MLPNFTDRDDHDKLRPLTDSDVEAAVPEPVLLEELFEAASRLARPLKVLDFGCGRGDLVGILRRLGYAAYGVDVVEAYIRSGISYFGPDRDFSALSLLRDGRSIFPDGYFDFVLSDQVLEHVEDLDSVASEIARITVPGGSGLHIFPAHRSVFEVHMRMPVVHWLPKGAPRKAAIKAMLKGGVGAKYFESYSLEDRASIFSKFSDGQTYYRSLSEIKRVFIRHGMHVSSAARAKLKARGGKAAHIASTPILGALAAALYGKFNASYIRTTMAG